MLLLQILQLSVFESPLLVLLSEGRAHGALVVRGGFLRVVMLRLLLLLLLVGVEVLMTRNVACSILRVGSRNLTNLRGTSADADSATDAGPQLGVGCVGARADAALNFFH